MMEAVAVLCGEAVLEGQARGQAPGPGGNRHPAMAPHGCFPARGHDGGEDWIAIAVSDDLAWSALVEATGDLRLRDPRFARLDGRRRFEDEIDGRLAEWTRGQDAARAESDLCARGVAAARVVPLYELYDQPDPNFLATGFVSEIVHPEVGPSWLPGRPWRFASGPSAALRPAPCVGEHSREILVGELGLTEAEYAGLVASGVTGSLSEGA
jgi:crotonobetainyl-CoA:carnitine CoA-transferase CaiB-like acyl-CoA transferase